MAKEINCKSPFFKPYCWAALNLKISLILSIIAKWKKQISIFDTVIRWNCCWMWYFKNQTAFRIKEKLGNCPTELPRITAEAENRHLCSNKEGSQQVSMLVKCFFGMRLNVLLGLNSHQLRKVKLFPISRAKAVRRRQVETHRWTRFQPLLC